MNRIIILSYSSLLFKNLSFETPVPERVDDIENILNIKPALIILPYYEQIYFHNEIFGVWEILIWLRIQNIMSHVCVVGNFSIESLFRYEKRAVMLSSRGVSYMQLPESLNQEKINKKIADEADPENVRSIMSMLLDIQHMRHVYANIWGLERLVQVHKKYYNFDWTPSEEYIKKEKSLDYQMAKYVFVKEDENNETQDNTTLHDLIQLKNLLKNKPKLTILLIDDKAELGWESVIKSLINQLHSAPVILSMPIGNYHEDLMEKFLQIHSIHKVDIIISDLRLYSEEESEIDYNCFKSIRLMKKIYNTTYKRHLVYRRVRYIMFTASNQLMNYKNVIRSKYAPSGIFVKEGFDHIINSRQQEENYRNLINALTNAIRENSRKSPDKAGGKVDSSGEDESQKFAYVDAIINHKVDYAVLNEICTCLDKYDHVLIDTNIFYDDKPFIALCSSNKIRCFYPVYFEMDRIAGGREASYRSYMADKACLRYQNKIFKEGLTPLQIKEIDIGIKDGVDGLADRYFLPAIKKMHQNNANLKIIFITNDTIKEDSPLKAVSNWIADNQISNITVLCPREFYNTNGIILPKNSVYCTGESTYNLKKKSTVNSIELGTLKNCSMSKDGKSYTFTLHNNLSISISIHIQEFKKPTDISGFEIIKYIKYTYKDLPDLKKKIIKDWPEKK
jgi:hypothetical protein